MVVRAALWSKVPPGDDAMIVCRVAFNLTHGLGPVFNAGERVWSWTSPGWLGVSSLGALMGDPTIGQRLAAIACDCAALLLGGPWWWAWLVLWPAWAVESMSGMESPLVLLGLVAVMAGIRERREKVGALGLACLSVARPETAALALLAACWLPRRARWGLLGLLAWVPPVLYFGQLLPHTLEAKRQFYAPRPWSGISHIQWLLPIPNPLGFTSSTLGHLLCGMGGLVLVVLARAWRQWRLLAVALFLSVAHYAAGSPPFQWYSSASVMASLWLCLAVMGRPQWSAVFVALSLLYYRRATGEANKAHDLFTPAARWLEQRAVPGDVVFCEPLGYLGAHNLGLRFRDYPGLVGGPAGRDGWMVDWLKAERPRFVVLRPLELATNCLMAGAAGTLYADSLGAQWMEENYRRALEPDDAKGLVVLERRR